MGGYCPRINAFQNTCISNENSSNLCNKQ